MARVRNTAKKGPNALSAAAQKRAGVAKPYLCPFDKCNLRYASPRARRYHIRTLHEGVRFSCPHQFCHKHYARPSTLNYHIKGDHNGVRWRCSLDEYESEFKRPESMRAHVRDVHKGVIHACHLEGCEFRGASAKCLTQHLEGVHGDKVHVCWLDDCQKSYSRKDYLIHHVSIFHEGARFHCTADVDCKREFCSNQALKAHTMREHGTDEERAQLQEIKQQNKKRRAEKEKQGICSATLSYQEKAGEHGFHCKKHADASNIIDVELERVQAAGKLKDSSVQSADCLISQMKNAVRVEKSTAEALRLLRGSFGDLAHKSYFLDTKWVLAKGRLMVLELTIKRANGETVVSCRVDYGLKISELLDLIPNDSVFGRRTVFKVWKSQQDTSGLGSKTPEQIGKMMESAGISKDALF